MSTDLVHGYDLVTDIQDAPPLDTLALQYVQPPATLDHLICPICKLPFTSPFSTICGHTFCKKCLIESFKSVLGKKCPLDRIQLHIPSQFYDQKEENEGDSSEDCDEDYDIYPAPIILSNMTDDLKVKCVNHMRGCQWIGPRWSINIHVLGDCPYTRVKCECGELTERRLLSQDNHCVHQNIKCDTCKASLMELDLDDHLDNHCELNLLQCLGCQLMLPKMHMSNHEVNCNKIYLSCPGTKFGCEWRGQRDVLDTVHRNECVFIKLTNYFNGLGNQIDDLSYENSSLKLQVSSILNAVVQGKVHNLGYSLDVEDVRQITQSSSLESQTQGNNGKLKINMGKVKMIVGDLELNKRITEALVQENVTLRDELASQRAMMTTMRQQMQYLLLDRHRQVTKLSNGLNSTDSSKLSTKL